MRMASGSSYVLPLPVLALAKSSFPAKMGWKLSFWTCVLQKITRRTLKIAESLNWIFRWIHGNTACLEYLRTKPCQVLDWLVTTIMCGLNPAKRSLKLLMQFLQYHKCIVDIPKVRLVEAAQAAGDPVSKTGELLDPPRKEYTTTCLERLTNQDSPLQQYAATFLDPFDVLCFKFCHVACVRSQSSP